MRRTQGRGHWNQPGICSRACNTRQGTAHARAQAAPAVDTRDASPASESVSDSVTSRRRPAVALSSVFSCGHIGHTERPMGVRKACSNAQGCCTAAGWPACGCLRRCMVQPAHGRTAATLNCFAPGRGPQQRRAQCGTPHTHVIAGVRPVREARRPHDRVRQPAPRQQHLGVALVAEHACARPGDAAVRVQSVPARLCTSMCTHARPAQHSTHQRC